MTVRLFRIGEAGGSAGGNTFGPSLSELGDGDGAAGGGFKSPDFTPPAAGEGAPAAGAGEGAPKPGDGAPKPGEGQPGAAGAGTGEPKPGEQKTPEQVAEEQRLETERIAKEAADKAKKEGDEPAEFDLDGFFGEVDKITGMEVKVEYPENIDPLSAQGIAIRDGVIREQGIVQYDEFLAKKDPRSYAYMLHRQAGGTDEEFFDKNNPGFVLPTKEELAASADMQKQVYTAELKSKGMDDEAVTLLVEKAIKDNKLKEKAEAAHTRATADQAEHVKRLQDQQELQKKEFDKQVASAMTAIDNTIKTHIRFILPENVQGAFKQYVANSLRYEEGNFYSTTQLTDVNLKEVLEALFFQYHKGDLSQFVQREVKTKAAQSLRTRLADANKRQNGGGSGGETKPTYVPLGEL